MRAGERRKRAASVFTRERRGKCVHPWASYRMRTLAGGPCAEGYVENGVAR